MEKGSTNCTVLKSKKKESTNTVPFHKLFSFADSSDIILMSFGTIGAICHGLCMPLMSVFFGEVVDSFGKAQNNIDMARSVSEVRARAHKQFIYVYKILFNTTIIIICNTCNDVSR